MTEVDEGRLNWRSLLFGAALWLDVQFHWFAIAIIDLRHVHCERPQI
jgi:hypothetical protein